jgi:hypothetical protein
MKATPHVQPLSGAGPSDASLAAPASQRLQQWSEFAREQLRRLLHRKERILALPSSGLTADYVQRTVLAQDAALNELLEEASELAARLLAGEVQVETELRSLVEQVAKHTWHHLAFEESYWLPAVVSAGLWGAEQSEQLARHHHEHASTLSTLELGDNVDRVTFAEAVTRLAQQIRAESEQEDVLTHELFRLKGLKHAPFGGEASAPTRNGRVG